MARGQSFPFLVWFEVVPAHAAAAGDLLFALRQTPEWACVNLEIDIRQLKAKAVRRGLSAAMKLLFLLLHHEHPALQVPVPFAQ